MNDIETLRNLVNKKIENQGILREKYKQLDNLYVDLRSSKIYRWFGSSYLTLKRIATLLIGIFLLISAIVLYVHPKIILDEEKLEELTYNLRQDYTKKVTKILEEASGQLAKDNSRITRGKIIQKLNQSIDKSIEKEIIASIKVLAVVSLFVSLIFFYVSRLSKKMRRRNSKISKAESLTQEIIRNFKVNLEEGEKEIALLQEFLSSKN